MLTRLLKLLGIVVGVLLGLVVVAGIAIFALSEGQLGKTYDVPAAKLAIPIPTDADSIARGKLIATTLGDCTTCHGKDFAGGKVAVDPALGEFNSANLTPGQGGVGASYSAEDFVRVLRYGVKKNGRSVLVMPSAEFAHMDDADLGAVVAFLKSLPPTDKQLPPANLTFLGRALLVVGQVPPPAASILPVGAPRPADVPHQLGADYGKYLASVGCGGCHNAPSYTGGKIAGVPPDWPSAPNLTAAGELSVWTEADFITAMHTGKTPTGRQLRAEYMAYSLYGKLPDAELKSIYTYLKSLPK